MSTDTYAGQPDCVCGGLRFRQLNRELRQCACCLRVWREQALPLLAEKGGAA